MEDFNINAFLGFWAGMIIGIIVVVILYAVYKEKIKISGSYLTYENVIYKQVPQEELDNIIILEVK